MRSLRIFLIKKIFKIPFKKGKGKMDPLEKSIWDHKIDTSYKIGFVFGAVGMLLAVGVLIAGSVIRGEIVFKKTSGDGSN
jgi:Na+/citrate or Na+/malate symporter